jgi:hypothetical protein
LSPIVKIFLRHYTSSLGLGFIQATRHFNRFRPSLHPLERDQESKLAYRCPLVLTSAITWAVP